MLREEADSLQQQDKNLFGKKFREYLIMSAKSKKQTNELFYDKSKKKSRSPFDMACQRYRGGALGGCTNSSSQRIVLVQWDNNKVSADINKEVATEKVKTNRKEPMFNMPFPQVLQTSELENVHLVKLVEG